MPYFMLECAQCTCTFRISATDDDNGNDNMQPWNAYAWKNLIKDTAVNESFLSFLTHQKAHARTRANIYAMLVHVRVDFGAAL